MTPSPNLAPARELLGAGMRLVKLCHYSKQPEGNGWNLNFAKSIIANATGYGLPLAVNGLCSIDPDNEPLAVIGMRALGFNLEAIMAQGVRTRSTRPGSGGRSAFAAEGDICWVKFSSKETGTVLELLAHSPNLQDCVPGVVYYDKQKINLFTQEYANDLRYDEPPPLPDDLFDWWERCSKDIEFLHTQQDAFFEAIRKHLGIAKIITQKSISTGKTGRSLAYPAPGVRTQYNAKHEAEELFQRHDYDYDERVDRWAPPTATGKHSVRKIPGKDGLWHSDHASDPLHGTFDAWTAHVVLDHNGDVEAAIAEWRAGEGKVDISEFLEKIDPETGEIISEPKTPPRFRLLSVAEVAALPPLSWRIKRVLPSVGLAAIYGPSASGKSFLILDMLAAISDGRDWHGYKCFSTIVVYVCLEGEGGLSQRIQAYRKRFGDSCGSSMRFVTAPFRLFDSSDVGELARIILAAGGHGAVVCLDTLNQATPGADENSSEDMGRAIASAKALQAALGGLVLLVHHAGKDLTRGMRGHSSLFAALDAVVEVSRDGEYRSWKVTKSKDGAEGAEHPFKLEVVELGLDEDLDVIDSCVIAAGDPKQKKEKRLTPAQQSALNALLDVCRVSGRDYPDKTLGGVAAHLDEWRAAFYAISTADNQDAKQKAFSRARNDLVTLGKVAVLDDMYRPMDIGFQASLEIF